MVTKLTLKIPSHLDFADLNLMLSPLTGDLIYDVMPLQIICDTSEIPFESIVGDAKTLRGVIDTWYRAHMDQGGPHDQVQELLLSISDAEAEYGYANVQPSSLTLH